MSLIRVADGSARYDVHLNFRHNKTLAANLALLNKLGIKLSPEVANIVLTRGVSNMFSEYHKQVNISFTQRLFSGARLIALLKEHLSYGVTLYKSASWNVGRASDGRCAQAEIVLKRIGKSNVIEGVYWIELKDRRIRY